MRKRRGLSSAALGLAVGFFLGFVLLQGRFPMQQPKNQQPDTFRTASPEAPQLIGPTDRDSSFNSISPGLLYVGVMTAEKYLSNRAKAVYETWGKDILELPGEIGFFSSAGSKVPHECPDLPLIALPRVDDSYPPQKKSFLMLQYMWQHYGDKYEWFLRADDDVYVRTSSLEKFLRSLDSRKPAYIGQAGRGNSEEFGLLSLEYDENFCMGGPGVILSRETLRRIVPHIKDCLANLYTTHEDVELGRCVRKYAGIPCTWSYEMQSILYHNSSGDLAFTGKLKTKEVHRAITMHPIKNPPHMYRLHNYMRGLEIQDLQQTKIQLFRDIRSMGDNLNIPISKLENYSLAKDVPLFPLQSNSIDFYNPGDIEFLGSPASLLAYRPYNTQYVIPWDFISRSEYSLADTNPRRRIHSQLKEGLDDITREVMASINACSRQRGRIVEEKSTLYGYRRLTPYGADTVLDLLLLYRKYRGRKLTLMVRRHVYLHQHFTGLEIRESQDTSNAVIHFIVPLSGRHRTFRRFLENYEEECLLKNEKTELLVILFSSNNNLESDDEDQLNIQAINDLKNKYKNSIIRIFQETSPFSRARALDRGASLLNDEDLMFFIDVDIVFTSSALTRIRFNTLKNNTVYFPVVYSQYDPRMVKDRRKTQKNTFEIDELAGFWRLFGFGIAALYKTDYKSIGGFDLTIEGWGKEDVDFFEKAIRSKHLQVFRAPDVNLVHVYHGVTCNESLKGSQLTMCKGTRADTYASTQQLAALIYRNPEYLRFAKARRNITMSPSAA